MSCPWGRRLNNAADPHKASLILQYRRRLIRKRLLWRAYRSRHDLTIVSDNRNRISPGDILSFTTLRNEAQRLPYFLDHYRSLGVRHFFVVDNGSTDDGSDLLKSAPDVTLFQTQASYRGSRFGVDWLNWLKWRHAAGHWVLVVDADEILVYPDHDTRSLQDLTAWLDAKDADKMGAFMLDMYPKGSPDTAQYTPGEHPATCLEWFDAHGYWVQRQPKLDNLWLQGGVRARKFFADDPDRAPTLNKIPLVRWKKPYAFVNSTHSALPSHLNHVWTTGVSGVLLHSKFLPGTALRAQEEKARDEHFQVGTRYADYYDALQTAPDLWDPTATRYSGWQQLVDLGLMKRPDW